MVKPLEAWPNPIGFHLTIQIFISDNGGIEPSGSINKIFSATTDKEAREEALSTIKRNRDSNPDAHIVFQAQLARSGQNGKEEIWRLDELASV